MRYTTVLFDLDHMLLDSNTAERLALNATLSAHGVDDPEQHLDTYRTINNALWKQVEAGELSPNEVKFVRFERFADVIGLDVAAADLAARFVAELPEHGELFPGVPAMLEALAAHPDVTLGMVTNGIGTIQRRRLERLALVDRFPHVAISGEVGVAKPDPAIFEHLGLPSWDAATTVMIGDSLTSDIAAGAAAGIDTIWYNPHDKPMTGPATPTVQARSIDQIHSLLLPG